MTLHAAGRVVFMKEPPKTTANQSRGSPDPA